VEAWPADPGAAEYRTGFRRFADRLRALLRDETFLAEIGQPCRRLGGKGLHPYVRAAIVPTNRTGPQPSAKATRCADLRAAGLGRCPDPHALVALDARDLADGVRPQTAVGDSSMFGPVCIDRRRIVARQRRVTAMSQPSSRQQCGIETSVPTSRNEL